MVDQINQAMSETMVDVSGWSESEKVSISAMH